MKVSFAWAAAVLATTTSVLAIDPIVIKGSKFFNSKTGEQFFFKGMAYQPRTGVSGDLDPLADTVGCKRDVEIFKELGINSIRVYEVDYNKNHDTCMKLLEDAGIYLILDLPSPKYSINRAQPYWDTDMMAHWKAKVDAFSKYSNLLAWIAGNEVTNDKDTTPASAFVKASIRDMKAYIKSKGLKTPVGYADNDDMDIRMNLINYFNCGDEASRADFYGINIYRWCGDTTTFKTSGYEDVTKNMTGYSIPSLLTEYGCNKIRPRTYPELKSLYGKDMSGTFSGGIMYEYSEETNEYGIVKVSYGNPKLEKTKDFDNLKTALKNIKPETIKMNDYKPSDKPSTCPSIGSAWKVKSDTLPPTPSTARCECMVDTLGCTLKGGNLTASEGKALGETIGSICGQTDCGPISYDASKGAYGDFVACDSGHRASWALNKNYENQKKAKCEAKGIDTKTVQDPKQKDAKSCLKEKDDIGFPGKISASGSSDSSSGDSSGSSGSNDGKSESASPAESSKKSAASAASPAVPALLAALAALAALF
ncbi:1 3-beta-glucanosyltransferase gel4 [Dipsacomyces acuminosporus]|nr:1 3-beta-glucanosyltransferase gel4 [Dipsacomyces acuminosporus]